MASEVKSVPPVGFRRQFHNLPKRERNKQREQDEDERGSEEKSEEKEQRERPGDPDAESTIDVTA